MPSHALALLNELIDDLSTPRGPVKAAPAPVPTAAKPAVAKAKAEAAKPAAAKAASAPVPPPAAAADESNMPPTQALYQTDTYLFTASALVLEKKALESGAWVVALDATCFHPQGGGQPADTGSITVAGGEPFQVKLVKKDPRGVVWHEGEAEPSFAAGARVDLKVTEAARVYNARVHSAGHLIDVAMGASGCTLRPTKGYHFTPGAYVEYEGKLDAAEREALVPKVQASMEQLIAQGVKTEVKEVEAQKLDTACPPNALPPERNLWGTGWVRVVCVGGQGCPCGGTHIKDTSELGKVQITGIKVKGKITRVSYTVD